MGSSASPSPESWYNITGGLSGGPPPLTGASMTYDPSSGSVVLFGGCSVNQCPLANQTWSFSGGTWSNVTGSSPQPPARSYATMVFDAADGYLVLFGGIAAGGRLLNDTWTYAAGRWTNITNASAPSPRWAAGIAFDHTDSEVVLFGGCGTANPCMLRDTWFFQAGTWTDATTTVRGAPPPRYGASFDWDAYGGYSLLFGGCEPGACPANDTWQLMKDQWTLEAPGPVNPPARSYGGLSAYRPANGSVLIGGEGATGPLGGVWFWSNGQWINATNQFRSAPSPRYGEGDLGSTVSWLGSTAKTLPYLLIFGGSRDPCAPCGNVSLDDTWVLEPTITVTAQALPSVIEVGELTSFTATGAGGTPPFAFVWDLGDGSMAFGPTADHSFSTVGNDTVTVTATDSAGADSAGNVTVTVVLGPSISIRVAPSATDVRQLIRFSGSVTGGRPPFSHLWSFGDFWTSNQPNATHAYANPGQYLVEFTVTDFVQGSAIAFANVTINPPLEVQVIPSTLTGVVGKPVAFTGTLYGGTSPFIAHWSFGDGSTSTLLATSHAYSSRGNYSAQLCTTDAANESSCANLTVQIADGTGSTTDQHGSNPGSSISLLLFAIGVGTAVAIAAVALVLAIVLPRRTKRRRPLPPPSAVIAAMAAASDEEWEDHRRKDARYASRRR
ncbi:MAG TPA: PKD domain-containing protein [Thermoplasmata archaeon]|nr:PKD domain-containing protein [Thermoplasmata archaeon]